MCFYLSPLEISSGHWRFLHNLHPAAIAQKDKVLFPNTWGRWSCPRNTVGKKNLKKYHDVRRIAWVVQWCFHVLTKRLGGKQIQNSAFWFKHCSQIGYTDMLQTHSQHKVILSFNRIYRSAILSCFQSWNLEVHFEAQMLGKTYLITLAQER